MFKVARHLVIVLAVLLAISGAQRALAQTPSDESVSERPAWFDAEVDRLTANDGRWVADNARYKNEAEVFDAYGVEWTRNEDGNGITGRLFGLTVGTEVADFWQFAIDWNPEQQRVDVKQTGSGGTVGLGTLVGFGEATLMEQTFSLPDGRQWQSLHHSWFENGIHVTAAYDWKDHGWEAGRTYRWKQTP